MIKLNPELERTVILHEALIKAVQALEVAAEALESAGNYPRTLELVNGAIEDAMQASDRADQIGRATRG